MGYDNDDDVIEGTDFFFFFFFLSILLGTVLLVNVSGFSFSGFLWIHIFPFFSIGSVLYGESAHLEYTEANTTLN